MSKVCKLQTQGNIAYSFRTLPAEPMGDDQKRTVPVGCRKRAGLLCLEMAILPPDSQKKYFKKADEIARLRLKAALCSRAALRGGAHATLVGVGVCHKLCRFKANAL